MYTITITDPMQVRIGDKAYFKDCDFGFAVSLVDNDDTIKPFTVVIPFSESVCWALSSQFDHATREVEEPEWPDPHDTRLRIYLGADGKRYIYNPIDEADTRPWVAEGYSKYHSCESMEAYYHDALPLTELKLVPAKDDDNEQ
jgi:hypothetical protein